VLLPAAAEESLASREAEAPQQLAQPLPLLHGRVLLVEDEPMVSAYVNELMSGWGLDVVMEKDPRAAARRLSADTEHFDLLVTDQTMPGMTGLALARHAKQHRPRLPVVLYTGNAADIPQVNLSASGVSRLLRKPIDAVVLRLLLGELLEQTARVFMPMG
jgi:CheY-like chemotaxis protein